MKVDWKRKGDRRQRGTALILAILLSVVLTAIVLCLALAGSIQSNTSSALVKNDATFYAAEYAMQDTLWRYRTNNTYRAALGSPRTMTLTLGGQVYNCSVSCVDAVGFPTIEWKFDEGTGSTTTDNSGNGNTGTLNGATWTSIARQGAHALYFDGATSFVNAGNSPSTNLTGNVTMAAWVRMSSGASDQKIGGNENGTYGGYKFYIYNSKVVLEVRDSFNNSTRNKNQPGGTVLALNTWYHVAGVYSETNHWIKTYVNGVEDVSRRMPGLPANALGLTTPQFVIGREPFDNLYYFGGVIDDVRVYNSELSDASIMGLYNTAVDVHATATLNGTKNTAAAAVTVSVPLPPPPVLPELVTGGNLTVNHMTVTGDLQVSGNLTGTTNATTVDGNILYSGTYTPAGKISVVNPATETITKGTVTVPVVDTASVNGQAQQTYTSAQTNTTFTFTPLGGNKVIRVNGDVTNPQFDLTTGVFPSGGTLIINGNLTINTTTPIGNSTNGVYIIVTGNCTMSTSSTIYGALYVGGTWSRKDVAIYGPVVVQGVITDTAGLSSTFTTGTVPWFDPRVISYNGATVMPMLYSDFHDDNN